MNNRGSAGVCHTILLVRLFAVCLVAAFGTQFLCGGTIFNLRRDFSTNSNPNGVWSYGWQETPGGVFTLLTNTRSATADNGVPCNVWEYGSHTSPLFIHFPKSNKRTGISDGGQGRYPPGTLLYYAATDDTDPKNLATVRFIAPSNATYKVTALVRSYLNGPPSGDADFHVAVNGRAFFNAFLPSVSATSYVNRFVLTRGSSVDFAVGRGADGRQYGSGLKIQVVIALLTNSWTETIVPPEYAGIEPGSGSSLLRSAIRLQQVHAASAFPPFPILVRELRFRPSSLYGEPFSTIIPDFRIHMSTTQRGPRSLHARFVANIGDGSTLVFRGPLRVSSQFHGPMHEPKSFDIVIPLTKPFLYDSRRGNLLIDYRNVAGSTAAYIDAGASPNAGRAFDLNAFSRKASTVDDGTEVVQILFEKAPDRLGSRDLR